MRSQINPLPQDPNVAKSFIKAQADTNRMQLERGWIGVVLGSKASAPFNIAALVVVVCILTSAYLIIAKGGFQANKEALTFLGGFVTLALGYLFGKSSS